MGFVASPPAAPAPVADAIAGDGWWPDLSIAAFRDAERLGPSVSEGRARAALVSGAISAAIALASWRARQTAATLADVPGPSFGGEPQPLILWRRAVYAYGAAELVETHNDVSATDQGRKQNEQAATSAEDHRRNATVAIRDLLGETRSRVSLL